MPSERDAYSHHTYAPSIPGGLSSMSYIEMEVSCLQIFWRLSFLSFTDCFSISIVVCLGTVWYWRTYIFIYILWGGKKKNHTSNGLKRDETQRICARQNNDKDKEIWLEDGHPNFLPAPSFLVCHLASLLQPFDLGLYVLWCGWGKTLPRCVYTCCLCLEIINANT